MALVPIYEPEAAARILWRLILTGRAKIEQFDNPPPGYVGNPETFRNLAREYEHLKEDPKVVAVANEYLETHDRIHHPETVQAGPSPRDFEPAKADQGSALRSDQPHVHMEGEESPGIDDFCPEF